MNRIQSETLRRAVGSCGHRSSGSPRGRLHLPFLLLLASSLVCGLHASPKNVIILIGDGMGFEHVKAAGFFESGAEGKLSFEGLPYKGEAMTYSASSSVTDSAASGTAIATGVKVNNDVISMAYPGGGAELQTLLEYFKLRGKRTGLVTTTFMTHATPATFGAHEPSRTNYDNIAADYLTQTKPNVLLGGGGNGLTVANAQAAGYQVVQDGAELLLIDTEGAFYADGAATAYLSGQFGSDHLPYEYDGLDGLPHLSEMTEVALEILDNDADGFFLMIEGGRIDHACHANDFERMIPEMIAFEEAFDEVMTWAQGRDDTLVIVTADHECGGLSVTANNGIGVLPTVDWSSTGHTGVNVPVYAWGPGAERVAGVLDNIDFFDICVGPSVELVSPPSCATLAGTQASFTCRLYDDQGLDSAELFYGTTGETRTFNGEGDVYDVEIQADNPNTNYEGNSSLNVDGSGPHAHGLMIFPTLIGSGPGQVPPGASIDSATLRVNCYNQGALMKMHRLLEDWVPTEVTWNQRKAGVAWGNAGADGTPSIDPASSVDADCTATGWRSLDVTRFVQEWANGSPNYGIVFVDNGSTDGVDFYSTESGTPPVLTVTFGSGWQEMGEVTGISATETVTDATVTFAPQTLEDLTGYAWNVRATNLAGEEAWAPADFDFRVDSATAYPALPVADSPADDAAGVGLSPTLSVTVGDPQGGLLDVVFFGRGATPPGAFEVVALPDTQGYTRYDGTTGYPETFTAQTQWIVDQATSRNIAFMTHEGDIVQNYNVEQEWIFSDASLSILDGVIPYGLVIGNHDIPTTLFNQYFPYTRYETNAWYGGHYPADANDNSYQLITAGGEDWLFLHLIYDPSADALAWADGVLKAHSQRKAVITTHSYLEADGTRTAPGTNVWNDVVVPNDNVVIVLCGHVSGEARRTDYVGRRVVHQILADYQSRQLGGDGWLRTLHFSPVQGQVFVETFSPTRNDGAGDYETDLDSQFSLAVPANEFVVIGTAAVDVSGGATQTSIVWPDLATFTECDWYVRVTNGQGNSQVSPIWRFTTGSADSTPPVITAVGESGITDHEATITWTTNEPADSLLDYGLDANYGSQSADGALVMSHTISLANLDAGATYHYRVTSADGSGNPASSEDCTFTTLAEAAPAAPVNLMATAGDGSVTLDWDDNTESDLAGYNVYRWDSQEQVYSLVASTDELTSTYTDTGLTNGTPYLYVVTAVDGVGLESGYSGEASATPADMTPPAAPTGLVATGGDGVVNFGWSANTEWDLAGYNVYRSTTSGAGYAKVNGSIVTGTPPSFEDGAVTNGTTYYYVVTAIDTNNNESDASAEVSATPFDSIPPGAPSGLAATGGDGVVNLAWDANTEWDLAGYNVYRSTTSGSDYAKVNGSIVTETSFADDTVTNGTTYYYVVRAVDTSNNSSGDSNEASAKPADGVPPDAPTGLTATAGNAQIVLDWDDSGATDLASYSVYRSTTEGGPYDEIATGLGESEYADSGVAYEVPYYYVVKALDTSGNLSVASSEATATLVDTLNDAYVTADPVVTYGVVGGDGIQGTTAAGDGLVQTFTESPNGTAGMASLLVEYTLTTPAVPNDITVLELHVAAFWTALDANDPLKVSIRKTSGELEAISANGVFVAGTPQEYVGDGGTIRVMFEDTEPIKKESKDTLAVDLLYAHVSAAPPNPPPAAPTGLAATGGDGVVNLVWVPNTSDGDLAGYNVYRGTSSGSHPDKVNASILTATSFADDTVTNGTPYYYVVTAVDTADGESAGSNEATATPVDATPPAVPAGLTASAGDTVVTLDWDDNSDGDLAGYNVYRWDSQDQAYSLVASTDKLTTAWSDTELANGTAYYYVLTAVDTSSNESGYSDQASATPQNGAPLPPANLVATAGDTQVTLTWDVSPEPDIAGYNVYSRTDPEGTYDQVNTDGLVTEATYTDTGLANDTPYYYVVTAVDTEEAESGYSDEASATPTDMTPPAVPTELAATAGDGQVSLEWADGGVDVAGYNVYRSTTPGGDYTQIGEPVTANAYTDSPVTSGTTYYYVVTAFDSHGNESGYSAEVSATPYDTVPPAAPTGLEATAGDGQVSLEWADNGEGDLVAGYNVYRSTTSGSGYAQINGSLVTESDYTDDTVENGTTYYYVVTAVDAGDLESGYSAEVSATPDVGSAISVVSITMTLIPTGKNTKGEATVTLSEAVAGATVTGTWLLNGELLQEGAFSTADDSGVAVIASPPMKVKTGDVFTFQVTDVTLTGYAYDSASNQETQDSITVE
ncbi:MAG: alkaline phosphatase [Planctomycetes bacterium]|nr:alkaline phosphatase [Planctomycetota bacterium]